MFIQLKRSLNNHYVFLHEEYDIIGHKALIPSSWLSYLLFLLAKRTLEKQKMSRHIYRKNQGSRKYYISIESDLHFVEEE